MLLVINKASITPFLISEIPIQDSERSNPSGIFVNNEICLSDISVYGFDYDYTLAQYKDELYHVLYDLGKEALIQKYKVCVILAEELKNYVTLNNLDDPVRFEYKRSWV